MYQRRLDSQDKGSKNGPDFDALCSRFAKLEKLLLSKNLFENQGVKVDMAKSRERPRDNKNPSCNRSQVHKRKRAREQDGHDLVMAERPILTRTRNSLSIPTKAATIPNLEDDVEAELNLNSANDPPQKDFSKISSIPAHTFSQPAIETETKLVSHDEMRLFDRYKELKRRFQLLQQKMHNLRQNEGFKVSLNCEKGEATFPMEPGHVDVEPVERFKSRTKALHELGNVPASVKNLRLATGTRAENLVTKSDFQNGGGALLEKVGQARLVPHDLNHRGLLKEYRQIDDRVLRCVGAKTSKSKDVGAQEVIDEDENPRRLRLRRSKSWIDSTTGVGNPKEMEDKTKARLRTFSILYMQAMAKKDKLSHADTLETRRKRRKSSICMKRRDYLPREKYATRRPDLEALQATMSMAKNSVAQVKTIGSIPSIPVGFKFTSRAEMVVAGMHSNWRYAIDYISHQERSALQWLPISFRYAELPIAVCVVTCAKSSHPGANADEIIFTQEKRRGANGESEPDRSLMSSLGTLSLRNSITSKNPVRVLKRCTAKLGFANAYIYEGLYQVTGCVDFRSSAGIPMYSFTLHRLG